MGKGRQGNLRINQVKTNTGDWAGAKDGVPIRFPAFFVRGSAAVEPA